MTDSSPDRHLGKALAHAPDRHAVPPDHVSAQILAAAHRATQELVQRPAARRTPWWRKPWGASGALATVVMAGFMGLLWRGEPPGPAVDAPSQPVAQAPQTNTTALPEVVATQGDAPASGAGLMAKTAAAAPAAAPPSRPPAAQIPRDALKAEARGLSERAAAAVQAPVESPAAPATTAAVADSASPPRPALAPAPPPAPSPAPSLALSPAAPALAAMPSQRAVMPQAARAMAASPQQSLPLLLANDQFSWLPPFQGAAPDAAWMQQLAGLTGNRWLPEERSPPADSAALRVERGSLALGLLRLEPDAVWWCPTGQNCLMAKVPPEALRDLISKLPSNR